jgi:hypothetical protein
MVNEFINYETELLFFDQYKKNTKGINELFIPISYINKFYYNGRIFEMVSPKLYLTYERIDIKTYIKNNKTEYLYDFLDNISKYLIKIKEFQELYDLNKNEISYDDLLNYFESYLYGFLFIKNNNDIIITEFFKFLLMNYKNSFISHLNDAQKAKIYGINEILKYNDFFDNLISDQDFKMFNDTPFCQLIEEYLYSNSKYKNKKKLFYISNLELIKYPIYDNNVSTSARTSNIVNYVSERYFDVKTNLFDLKGICDDLIFCCIELQEYKNNFNLEIYDDSIYNYERKLDTLFNNNISNKFISNKEKKNLIKEICIFYLIVKNVIKFSKSLNDKKFALSFFIDIIPNLMSIFNIIEEDSIKVNYKFDTNIIKLLFDGIVEKMNNLFCKYYNEYPDYIDTSNNIIDNYNQIKSRKNQLRMDFNILIDYSLLIIPFNYFFELKKLIEKTVLDNNNDEYIYFNNLKNNKKLSIADEINDLNLKRGFDYNAYLVLHEVEFKDVEKKNFYLENGFEVKGKFLIVIFR